MVHTRLDGLEKLVRDLDWIYGLERWIREVDCRNKLKEWIE